MGKNRDERETEHHNGTNETEKKRSSSNYCLYREARSEKDYCRLQQ